MGFLQFVYCLPSNGSPRRFLFFYLVKLQRSKAPAAGCDDGDHRHTQFPDSPLSQSKTKSSFINFHAPITGVQFRRLRMAAPLLPPENCRNSIRQTRAWGSNLRTGMVMGDYGDDDGYGDEEEEEDEDRSLDLLIRFVENVFRKVSRKARKAVKSVLPVPISTRLYNLRSNRVASVGDGIRWSVLSAMYMDSTLVDGISEYRELIIYLWLQQPVGFAVNGTLILTFLWVLKAFIEGNLQSRECSVRKYFAHSRDMDRNFLLPGQMTMSHIHGLEPNLLSKIIFCSQIVASRSQTDEVLPSTYYTNTQQIRYILYD
ncbi:hypothetical protein OROGR_009754 [Orobanche gracilis]